MKIDSLIRFLEFIKGLKGNIDLYDISEYRGKIFLDFKCDFHPYEITYTLEDINEFNGDNKEMSKSLSLVNEIYVDNHGKQIKNIFYIYKDSNIIQNS